VNTPSIDRYRRVRVLRQVVLRVMLMGSVGTSGCATRHAVERPAADLVVHTFNRDYTNAHLVARGDEYFLVDAGLERNGPRLASDLRDAGFDPARLRAIIVTHGHADHAGGAGYFQRTWGTPIVVGEGDTGLLSQGHNDALCPTSKMATRRLQSAQAETFQTFAPNVTITQATDLRPLTGIPGRVVPIPGHTEGSIAVIVDGAALVGDLLRGSVVGSAAKIGFYMCDVPDNRRDIATLVDELAPTANTFFVGHFGPVDRGSVAALARPTR